MYMFATVIDSHVVITDLNKDERLFSARYDVAEVALIEFFRAHEVHDLACSSSVDFAHQYGVPAGVNIWEMLTDSLTIANGAAKA